MDIISKGTTGPALYNAIQTLPKAGRTLLAGLKRVGGLVVGSPQSFLRLRSKTIAAWTVFGPYTIMINLCPHDGNMHWVFTMADKGYTFDACGRPQGRPNATECSRIVAANFFSCAHGMHAYFAAFCDVYLGWPMGATTQLNPDCLFGIILTFMQRYETNTRGGMHEHAQANQPTLQATNVLSMLADSAFMQDRLFEFAESIACSYMPHFIHASPPGKFAFISFTCVLLHSSLLSLTIMYTFMPDVAQDEAPTPPTTSGHYDPAPTSTTITTTNLHTVSPQFTACGSHPGSSATKRQPKKRQRKSTPWQQEPAPSIGWDTAITQAAYDIAELVRQLPLDGSLANEQILDYVARVVLSVNMHHHTHTCKKVTAWYPTIRLPPT